MTRSTVVRILVASLLLCVAGCGTSGGSEGAGVTTTSAATEPAETTVPAQEIVDALVIDASDLHAGEEVADYEAATDAVGQVTLDYCGSEFQTEGERTARHQTAIVDAKGDQIASNEAVAYTDGMAEAALDEMRSAIADCPSDEFTQANVEGVPALKYRAVPLPEADLADLAQDHIGAKITYSDEAGTSETTYFIFQRRGNVMVATYSSDQARAQELANAAGKRLAAADPGEVGE
jgi:hypothetical protein